MQCKSYELNEGRLAAEICASAANNLEGCRGCTEPRCDQSYSLIHIDAQ